MLNEIEIKHQQCYNIEVIDTNESSLCNDSGVIKDINLSGICEDGGVFKAKAINQFNRAKPSGEYGVIQVRFNDSIYINYVLYK